ncbi:uncharacterized protein LY79DRAFT_247019 [Colletotrichum navitas]|uniref:Uncharacterized protein n=1 Tax=Colletotrichum navitas TaxID=681940 RepID=A0AAD8V8R6_9PEZI|nr:uncharacterized protein LY79DRAFT_247019 [Colletotrichum navitas]KAK1598532.1 hypothetical protein LY79DRAFT_247019 [Colletotrichum navitas]
MQPNGLCRYLSTNSSHPFRIRSSQTRKPISCSRCSERIKRPKLRFSSPWSVAYGFHIPIGSDGLINQRTFVAPVVTLLTVCACVMVLSQRGCRVHTPTKCLAPVNFTILMMGCRSERPAVCRNDTNRASLPFIPVSREAVYQLSRWHIINFMAVRAVSRRG